MSGVDSSPLQNQVAVVTGGARGIGFACATRFLKLGAQVSIWDRDAVAAEKAAQQLGALGPVQVLSPDLTVSEEVQRAAQSTVNQFGQIDILLNNAGIAGVSKKLWECTAHEWKQVIDLNLVGVFHGCHAVVPHMLQRRYGRIINIASIAGKEGNPNASHYSAAKAGVIGLTKSLGKELATSGILVNCITPAVIDTDLLQQCSPELVQYMISKIPMGRVGQPAEVAALVAWLASAECSFSTGAVFDLSGGRATY